MSGSEFRPGNRSKLPDEGPAISKGPLEIENMVPSTIIVPVLDLGHFGRIERE